MSEKNIKDYLEKEIFWYVIANILIYICFKISFSSLFSNQFPVLNIIIKIIVSSSVNIIIFIFIFIADSLFSADFKTKILYFRFPFFKKFEFSMLPGEKIFTDLREDCNDFRFSKEDILKEYETIYTELSKTEIDKQKYQNKTWYSIYNKNRDKPMILASNREYLLTRDLFIVTFVTIPLYIIFSIIFLEKNLFSFFYLLYLFIMFVITNISARIKARRLVCNVIALDLQK